MYDKKDINKKTESEALSKGVVQSSAEYFDFIYTKAEKISMATYMVTSYMKDTEPLKKTMRQKTLSLLEGIGELRRKAMFGSLSYKESVEDNLMSLTSLFTIASRAGLVSETNAHIIETEITKVAQQVSKISEHMTENNPLGTDFFYVEKRIPAPEGHSPVLEHAYTGIQNKETTHVVIKDKHTGDSHVSHIENGDQIKPRKKNRRDFILSIIAKKSDVTIKDISTIFKGCSEKTIQRELITLVEEGVVLKEGERRWSRYRLARRL